MVQEDLKMFKKVKNFINNARRINYDFMLGYYIDKCEDARIVGDEDKCKYWCQKYEKCHEKFIKLLAKIENSKE
jgi:hypothetical protein